MAISLLHDVQHRGHQRGGARDDRFARLKVNLDLEPLGEFPQLPAERVERVAFHGEIQAAAEADPFERFEQRPIVAGDPVERPGKMPEIAVLAVVMEHDSVEPRRDFQQGAAVRYAEARIFPPRVGQVEVGIADSRIYAQADLQPADLFLEPRELRDRVEDDLVGEFAHLPDLGAVPADAVGVDFLAELFASQPRLGQRTARRPVHVFPHQAEDAPGREAFQREHGLRAGMPADVLDGLQVPEKFPLVNQVIRRREAHGRSELLRG